MGFDDSQALARCTLFGGGLFRVAAVYADAADNRTHTVWMSTGRAAKIIGCAESTVKRHAQKLKKMGVFIELSPARGPGHPPTIKINIDLLHSYRADVFDKGGEKRSPLDNEGGRKATPTVGEKHPQGYAETAHQSDSSQINIKEGNGGTAKEPTAAPSRGDSVMTITSKIRTDSGLRGDVLEKASMGWLDAHGMTPRQSGESDLAFALRAAAPYLSWRKAASAPGKINQSERKPDRWSSNAHRLQR